MTSLFVQGGTAVQWAVLQRVGEGGWIPTSLYCVGFASVDFLWVLYRMSLICLEGMCARICHVTSFGPCTVWATLRAPMSRISRWTIGGIALYILSYENNLILNRRLIQFVFAALCCTMLAWRCWPYASGGEPLCFCQYSLMGFFLDKCIVYDNIYNFQMLWIVLAGLFSLSFG